MVEYDDNKKFDTYPYYSGPLGYELGKDYTIFRLWAPSAEAVTLRLYKESMFIPAYRIENLEKKEDGLFFLRIEENLSGRYYDYQIQTNGKKYQAIDPYSTSTGANGERSMVLDLSSTNPEGWQEDKAPARQPEDIIYELHIKDFTYQSFSGISSANRGKFLGLTEENTHLSSDENFPTGLSYLKDLGITHVQLMPIYDYASVDELGDEENEYNWGYDPGNYNVPEGSYSSDPTKGEVRVRELKQMILSLHKAGLRVIMDVVYNHTYHLDSNLFKTEPWYFYRRNSDGTSSNGSGCGNDIASERPMVHRYIKDSVLYWASEYHIDGFRFDLMGLLDEPLLSDIRESLDRLYGKGEKLVYGEPWAAGSTAAKEGTVLMDKGRLSSVSPDIGAFCDATRDLIKGSTFDSTAGGFVNGGKVDLTSIAKAFTGWSNGDWRFSTAAPSQTISYVSSHDDWTLWDKLCDTLGTNGDYLSLDEDVLRANKLAAAMYMSMQGRPFLLSGEECARTKLGIRNTYNTTIRINRFDWVRAKHAKKLIDYYKGLFALRKQLPCLYDKSICAKYRLRFFRPISESTLLLFIENQEGADYKEICIVYTQEKKEFDIKLDGRWHILSDGDESNRLSCPIEVEGSLHSKGMEVMILGKL